MSEEYCRKITIFGWLFSWMTLCMTWILLHWYDLKKVKIISNPFGCKRVSYLNLPVFVNNTFPNISSVFPDWYRSYNWSVQAQVEFESKLRCQTIKVHLRAHSSPLWRRRLTQSLYWPSSTKVGEEEEVG